MEKIIIILKRMILCALAVVLALGSGIHTRAEESENSSEPQDIVQEDNSAADEAAAEISSADGDYADYIRNDNENDVDITVGETKQLKYRLGSNSDDRTEFKDEKITWSIGSGCERYIKVNSKGEVTALRAYPNRSIFVTATITNRSSVQYSIHVIEPTETVSFRQKQYYANLGSTATVIRADAWPSSATYPTLTFTVSDPSIAELDCSTSSARVTPKKVGKTIITAAAPNGVSASAELIVRDGKYADKITFKESDLSLKPGDSAKLDYVLSSETGNKDFSDEAVSWSVSCNDPDAFTLKNGVITAHKADSWFNVTASLSNGSSDTVDVKSRSTSAGQTKPAMEWDERREYSLPVGARIGLLEQNYILRTPKFDTHYIVYSNELTISSDNTDVLTVDPTGAVRAVSPGTAVITVKDKNYPDVQTSHEFKVGNKKKPESIQFISGPKEVCTGFTYVEPFLIKYSPEFADQETYWSSSDPSILTLNTWGSTYRGFTVGNKTGTVTITAYSASNMDVKAEFEVNVTDRKPSPDTYTTEFSIYEHTTEIRDGINYAISHKESNKDEYELRLKEEYSASMTVQGAVCMPDLPHELWHEFEDSGLFRVEYMYGVAAIADDTRYDQIYIAPIKTGETTINFFGKPIKIRVTDKVDYSFDIDKSDEIIKAGSQLQIKAVTNNPDPKTTWKSSDEKIAAVDAKGNVKGIKPGYATITATAEDGKTATCKIRVIFTDVPAAGVYYSDPVYWAVDKAITNGYTDSDKIIRTFKPQNNCTREAVVTFLWRLANKPEPRSMKSPFKDVQDKSKYYYKAVLWAAEKGITGGYSDGTFRPSATCLREHVVTFLYRYANKPDPGVSKNPFNDVKASDYYYKAALWANAKGIAKGYSTGKNAGGFGPKLDCLREHVVTFLYRYNSKYPQ